MKRKEAQALLETLEARHKWVKKQLKLVRDWYAGSLLRISPKDVLPPERMHYGSNHIDLIRWSQEDEVLKREIALLRRALDK